MNNSSPLIPQGSLMEQKNRSRSRVKVAFFCIVGVHVAGLMVLLMQGCKREQPPPPMDTALPTMDEPHLPVMDTNIVAPAPVDTNIQQLPPIGDVAIPTPPAPQEYVIQRGDTFSSIGTKLHVSVKAIQDANPNVDPKKLQIGQKIVIPAVTAPPAGAGLVPGIPSPADAGAGQIYVVKSGDTLTRIAAQHGTTVKDLRAANNLKTDKIKVGDKLILPPKSPAPGNAPAPIPTVPPAYTPAPSPAPPGQ